MDDVYVCAFMVLSYIFMIYVYAQAYINMTCTHIYMIDVFVCMYASTHLHRVRVTSMGRDCLYCITTHVYIHASAYVYVHVYVYVYLCYDDPCGMTHALIPECDIISWVHACVNRRTLIFF